MSAFDRVTAALKEPNKKRTPEEAAQLKADLAEMRDRAYLARRAGALDLDDAALAALAMKRAESSREDWSAATPDMPPLLKDAALEQVIDVAQGRILRTLCK